MTSRHPLSLREYLKQEIDRHDSNNLENKEQVIDIADITNEVEKRFVGCLLGLAIGDAKGMPAESQTPDKAQKVANEFNYVEGYLPKGHYTDDTNHAILLAESIISGNAFDADNFMEHMQEMDLTRGYGPTTVKSVMKYIQGSSVIESGHESPSNGAAMRVAPLALVYYRDIKTLRENVIKSAIVTHKTSEAVAGALSVAFSIAYMLNHFEEDFDKEEYLSKLIDFVKPVFPKLANSFIEDAKLMNRYGCRVLETVPYSIKAFLNNSSSFESTIGESIKGAGDADTIAAISGAISGALNGVAGIPKEWIDGLENGEKGKDYIVSLAKKLYKLSKELSQKK